MSDEEEWRAVPGYEGCYEVSDQGQVRSLDRSVDRVDGHVAHYRGRVLKQHATKTGHLALRLSTGGETRLWLVHRLVAEAFVPNPEGHPGVLHWDDNPANNTVENLRWGNQSQNNLDAVRNGTNFWATRTHCKYGHEFTPENTRMAGRSRKCKECLARRNAEWYKKKKEETAA